MIWELTKKLGNALRKVVFYLTMIFGLMVTILIAQNITLVSAGAANTSKKQEIAGSILFLKI